MPSKKMQASIEKANERVSEEIQKWGENFRYNLDDYNKPNGYDWKHGHDWLMDRTHTDLLDTLHHIAKNATNIPEDSNTLLAAAGVDKGEFEALKAARWKARVTQTYDQLAPRIGAEDMCVWYLEELQKQQDFLGFDNLPELLEMIEKDPSGQELVDAVDRYEGTAEESFRFGEVRWEYKEMLNAHFSAAEFEMPEELRAMEELMAEAAEAEGPPNPFPT